jgi:hypothetical protein
MLPQGSPAASALYSLCWAYIGGYI